MFTRPCRRPITVHHGCLCWLQLTDWHTHRGATIYHYIRCHYLFFLFTLFLLLPYLDWVTIYGTNETDCPVKSWLMLSFVIVSILGNSYRLTQDQHFAPMVPVDYTLRSQLNLAFPVEFDVIYILITSFAVGNNSRKCWFPAADWCSVKSLTNTSPYPKWWKNDVYLRVMTRWSSSTLTEQATWDGRGVDKDGNGQ